MKIITKFVGSSIVVFGLIGSLLGGSAVVLKKIEKSTSAKIDKAIAALHNTKDLDIVLRDEIIALNDFILLSRSPSQMSKYQQASSNFLVTLDELELLIPPTDKLEIIRRRHENILRLARELEDKQASLAEIQQDIRAINSFQADIELYLNYFSDHIYELYYLAMAEERFWEGVVFQINFVVIGLVLLALLLQFRLILLPVIVSVQELHKGAIAVGSGNLKYSFEIRTGDEIEQLGDEFNRMAIKLAQMYNSLEQKIKDQKYAEIRLKKLNEELENRVEERTEQLNKTVSKLQQRKQQLEEILKELRQTQSKLIQSEKMSSLGQMVAGVAHEINNPVNFIYGNLIHAKKYAQDLLRLINLYTQQYPEPTPEIEAELEAIELDFLVEDFYSVLDSMEVGSERIREIVKSLRTFSRLDEAEFKEVDLHESLDSTLMILHHRLKATPHHQDIKVIQEYGKLPLVECYAGQLNQVFMNLISNGIDAIEESLVVTPSPLANKQGEIRIISEVEDNNWVIIKIIDNGVGILPEVTDKLFDPFFTTKPVGKGTGLGLSISYQIVVDTHDGEIWCESIPGKGTKFTVKIPVKSRKLKPTESNPDILEKQIDKVLT